MNVPSLNKKLSDDDNLSSDLVLPSSVIPSDVIEDKIEENPSKAISEAQNKITDLNQVKIGIRNGRL